MNKRGYNVIVMHHRVTEADATTIAAMKFKPSIHRLRRAALLLAWGFANNAMAQLHLPSVPNTGILPSSTLPSTPLDPVTRELQDTATRVASPLNSAAQTTFRSVTARSLLREHRDVLEADPNGAPMVRHQIVALNIDIDALAHARLEGFEILEQRNLAGLDTQVAVLAAPRGMTTARALKRLRTLDPNGSYDFNHVYLQSGEVSGAATAAPTSQPIERTTGEIKVGLIDSGIDASHAVFQHSAIHRWDALCGNQAVASAHGTAVASLLIGSAQQFHGAAPGAQLYTADVYCGAPTGGALSSVAAALAWLEQQRVPVINISLVGPPNTLLEQLVRNASARGVLIVAAVGNDGPAAPPLYPAAYPDVIGVTAVDARKRVIVEAERGPQVDFAAPGADMAAATLNNTFATVRGTSFAAPIVAGLLAAELPQPDRGAAAQALVHLTQQAEDLGTRGRDNVYGEGLVGAAVRVAVADSAR